MGRQDGVLEAMDALERLVELRTDWHAVFVGDGEMLDVSPRHADRAKLAGHVSFLGLRLRSGAHRGDPFELRRLHLAEPRESTERRSTLIKVAEYMAVARPVVAFDLRETAHTAGGAAVLVADADSFARAISDLLDDPQKRAAWVRRVERVVRHSAGLNRWTRCSPRTSAPFV